MELARGEHRRDRGFTLVEIVVAIVLVGVLAAVVVVGVGSLTATGRSAACAASVDAARAVETTFRLRHGRSPRTIDELTADGGLELPTRATLDPTRTVATDGEFSLVLRRGLPATFSCDLSDRSGAAVVMASPGLTGHLRLGGPTQTDLVSGTRLTWPAGNTVTSGVWPGDGAVQTSASNVVLAGPYATADVAPWDIGLGSFTVAFWYRDPTPTAGTLVRKSDGSNANGWNGWIIDQRSTGSIGCRVHSDPLSPPAWTPALTPTTDWRHIACVIDRDAARLRVYVNGVERANRDITSLSGVDLDATTPLRINYGGTTDAVLDELSMWQRALTPTEIATLATAGS